MTLTFLCALALAYLLGSIPSAYLAGRWLRGLDIRRHGSGNMGATNVFRVLGPGPGAAVLLADTAKGVLAVGLLRLPVLRGAVGGTSFAAWAPCALGLAAVLGHSYTVFLGFRGGKGVATSLGVFLGLAPWATLAALGVFVAVLAATRMVSAGSLVAAAVLPGVLVALGEGRPRDPAGALGDAPPSVLILAMALVALVWVRHIPNIRRILQGTESRVSLGKKGES